MNLLSCFLLIFAICFIVLYLFFSEIVMLYDSGFPSFALSCIFSVVIFCFLINLEGEAENNFDKNTLNFSEAINTYFLSEESVIIIDKVIYNNGVNNLTIETVDKNDVEILIDTIEDYIEILPAEGNPRIEVYNVQTRYENGVLYTEKEIVYYKIYSDNVEEKQKIILND